MINKSTWGLHVGLVLQGLTSQFLALGEWDVCDFENFLPYSGKKLRDKWDKEKLTSTYKWIVLQNTISKSLVLRFPSWPSKPFKVYGDSDIESYKT